jgi:hypothetical protein
MGRWLQLMFVIQIGGLNFLQPIQIVSVEPENTNGEREVRVHITSDKILDAVTKFLIFRKWIRIVQNMSEDVGIQLQELGSLKCSECQTII